jgi:hypothetical protein
VEALPKDLVEIWTLKAIGRERRKRHTTLPVTVKCCRFHLGQSWWRKIQSLSLSNEYKDKESDIGKWLLMTFGIMFIFNIYDT